MLLPYKYFYYTPAKHCHLGDVINIVQQVHRRATMSPGRYFVFGQRCECCGVDAGRMMRQVLSVLDTPVHYGRSQHHAALLPTWVQEVPNPSYAKARHRPPPGTHLVCQFDQRSQGDKVPQSFLDLVKPDMINVGDRFLPCVNRTSLELTQKYEMIARASEYIGIDSGLTHLALLTDTPITVVHPPAWDARKFYPASPQLKFWEMA